MRRKGDKVTYCVAFLPRPDMAFPERKVWDSRAVQKRNVRFMQYEKSGTFCFPGGRDELCIRKLKHSITRQNDYSNEKCYYSQAPASFCGPETHVRIGVQKSLGSVSVTGRYLSTCSAVPTASHITKLERPDATVIYMTTTTTQRLRTSAGRTPCFPTSAASREGIPATGCFPGDAFFFLERIRREWKHRLRGLSHHLSSLLLSGNMPGTSGGAWNWNFTTICAWSWLQLGEGYLDGLEVVCCDYRELVDKYRDSRMWSFW